MYIAKLATLQCQITHSHGAWIHQIRYSLKAVPDFGNCLFSETKVERAWRSILLRTMTFASWRTLKGRFAYMFALAQTVMLLLHNMCDSPASCSAATSWELYSQVSLILSPFLACNIHLQLYMSCQSFTLIQHPHKPANVWKVAWDLWMRLAEMGRHLSWKWRSTGHPRYSIVLAQSRFAGSTTPRSRRCQWTSPTWFEQWIRRKRWGTDQIDSGFVSINKVTRQCVFFLYFVRFFLMTLQLAAFTMWLSLYVSMIISYTRLCPLNGIMFSWLWTACLSYQGAHAKIFVLHIVTGFLLKIHNWSTWWVLIVADGLPAADALLIADPCRLLPKGNWLESLPKTNNLQHLQLNCRILSPKSSTSSDIYGDPTPTAVLLRSIELLKFAKRDWRAGPHLWNSSAFSALENVGNILEVNNDEQETQRHARGFSW